MNDLLQHIDKVQAFVTIADNGSIQAASKQLRISQPALSFKIKNLEDAIGYKLFVRSKQGVELTAPGHNLYRFGKKLINDTEQLSLAMQSDKTKIRIGTYDIISHMVAAQICKIDSYRDISFRTERSGLILLEALNREEIDVAIVDDPPMIPGFQYKKITRSPFCIATNKQLAKSMPKSETARLQAIKEIPIIYVPNSIAHEKIGSEKQSPKMIIDSFVDQWGLGKNKRICVDSYALALELTLQGQGASLVLIGHILEHLLTGALVEAKFDELPMPYSSLLYTVTKSGRDQSQLQETINEVEGVFAKAVQVYKGRR